VQHTQSKGESIQATHSAFASIDKVSVTRVVHHVVLAPRSTSHVLLSAQVVEEDLQTAMPKLLSVGGWKRVRVQVHLGPSPERRRRLHLLAPRKRWLRYRPTLPTTSSLRNRYVPLIRSSS
jgi:hypothetical protein